MEAYMKLARKLSKNFETFHIERFPRSSNSHADALATLASAVNSEFKRTVEIDYLPRPSIKAEHLQILCLSQGKSWMDPITAYLKDDILPEDDKEAHKIRLKSARHWLSPEGKLYRKSFSGPFLQCVHPSKVEDLLFELHEGSCGAHTGGRSLAHRALTHGYWWPHMQKDALAYVQKCEKCQKFSPIIHQPATELHPITSPWPFAQWGLDIVGPLPRATANRRFLLVGTDYFTKWVEAEPLANIRDSDVKRFLWKSIITRFGIPRRLISDNGKQFESKMIREFARMYKIKWHYSTPGFPQSNGQAEASNKILLDGIKKRLEKAKGAWVDELPTVLWAYRTTPRRSTGETPFSLTYGTEAIIPLEIGLPSIRSEQEQSGGNDLALERVHDLSEERREAALIKLASYQQTLMRQRQQSCKERSFKVGDLVLRKVMGSMVEPNDGKLGPNWEGPYQVSSVGGTGAYHLETLNGVKLPRPWNVSNLRKFYQ